jgi:hypothetical protein
MSQMAQHGSGYQLHAQLQDCQLLLQPANLQQPDISAALQEQQQMQMAEILGAMQEQQLQEDDLVMQRAHGAEDRKKNKHGFRGVRKRPW